MSLSSSLGADDRIRLFCGLRFPGESLDRLARWQREALAGARDARLVAREQLHVTLAFLGSRPAREVEAIARELRAAAAAAPRPVLTALGYRETRSVGMLVFRDVEGRAVALAADVHERLERLGVYEREQRPWLPHVTVLRFRQRPGLTPLPPELGEVSPSDAALYHSLLRSGGAQHEVLDSVALGG